MKVQRKVVPRTPTGTVLAGLEALELVEEGWIRVSTIKQELARHGLESGDGLETYTDTGMVEITGEEGGARDKKRELEQRYI